MDLADLMRPEMRQELWGLIGLVAFMIGGVPLCAFAHWVAAPLAPCRKHRWQVTWGDWVCLGMMILPGLAIFHLAADLNSLDAMPLDFMFLVFTGTMWFLGVGSVSTVGLRVPWHRAAAILVIYPLNSLGVLIVAGLWAASITDQVTSANRMQPAVHTTFAVVSTVILGAMLICSRFTRGIAATIEPDGAASDPDLAG